MTRKRQRFFHLLSAQSQSRVGAKHTLRGKGGNYCHKAQVLDPNASPFRGLKTNPRRFKRSGWIFWLGLALTTAFISIVVSPVFAKSPILDNGEKQAGHLFYGNEKEEGGNGENLLFAVSESPSPNLTSADSIPELVQQGKTLYDAGRFTEAINILKQAAEAYKVQGDTLKQAAVLSNLSLTYQELGLWDEANKAISESLNLLKTEPGTGSTTQRLRILAQTQDIQGKLQLNMGQTESALATWKSATATYTQLGDEAGKIKSLINQAQAMEVLGLYRRALTVLNQVKQSLDTQPDSIAKVVGLRSLGDVLQLVGNLPQSRQTIEQSLEIARQLKSQSDISAALFSLANVARQEKKVEEALSFYQEAVTKSTSPRTRIRAQLNQLSLLIESENIQQAKGLLPEIEPEIDSLPPSNSAIYFRINLAESMMKLGNQESGDFRVNKIGKLLSRAIAEAKNLGDTRAEAFGLGTLGELYENNNQLKEAQELTEKALIEAQSIKASDILYPWQRQLGRLLKKQGNIEGAIAAYSDAVSTLQSLRSDLVAINPDVQFSFRESVEPIYREFVELLLPAEGKTTPDKLEKARQVIESLQLAELDNFFRTDCLNAKSVQIDNIDKEAAVIYPIILSNRLEVIVSLSGQPLHRYTTVLPQDQIEKTLVQLRQSLPQRTSTRYLPLAQQVYRWLIKPIETDLVKSNVKTLVFVLNGALRNIPVSALHNGDQFLIENYAVALTPGLELLESQPLGDRKLTGLIAGLSEAHQNFAALPNVEMEIQEINSLMSGKLLLNKDFTKTTIKDAIGSVPFPVVHLATHGQFSSTAENTFILTWDDRINVNELNNLFQKTDLRGSNPIELLVLSACETAKGDDRATLGIAGVAVRAGVRSTLASLWLVDDASTANLMVQFYGELTKGNVTKAEALRRAQVGILKDPKYLQHPYFWAPFVLVGNWL